MKFYMLDVTILSNNAVILDEPDIYLEGHNGNWIGGTRLKFTPEEPLRYTIEPTKDLKLVCYYPGAVPLMTSEMVQALYEAGVDNLEVFDAIVHDTENDITFDHYKSVNIVGTYAGVDTEASESVNLGIDDEDTVNTFYDYMVLRDDIPEDLHLFRLAESVKIVVVSEKVRDILIKHGLTDLEFLEEYE